VYFDDALVRFIAQVSTCVFHTSNFLPSVALVLESRFLLWKEIYMCLVKIFVLLSYNHLTYNEEAYGLIYKVGITSTVVQQRK